MDKQRLRNLTTKRLHTQMGDVYEDIEYITGMKGIMTHMIPNAMRSLEPWLIEKVTDKEYWDGEYSPELTGEFEIKPMDENDKNLFIQRYSNMKHPFA